MSQLPDRLLKGLEPGQMLLFDDVRQAAHLLRHQDAQMRAMKDTIRSMRETVNHLSRIKIG